MRTNVSSIETNFFAINDDAPSTEPFIPLPVFSITAAAANSFFVVLGEEGDAPGGLGATAALLPNKRNPPSCDFIAFPIGVILRDLLGDFLGPLLSISIL
jgi:hypothetical protein